MQAGCNPIVITLSAKNLRHFSNNQSTRHQNRFTPVGVAKLDAFLFSTGMTKTKLWVGLGSWFPRSRTRDPSATPKSRTRDLHPTDQDLSAGTPDPGAPPVFVVRGEKAKARTTADPSALLRMTKQNCGLGWVRGFPGLGRETSTPDPGAPLFSW